MNLPSISSGENCVHVPLYRRWNGFSACLFLVVLAVLSWGVHRRLSQYQLTQQSGGHNLTATKVSITERPQVVAPASGANEVLPIWLVIFALGCGLFFAGPNQWIAGYEVNSRSRRRRTRPSLIHFFFLPPPVLHLLSR